MTTINPITPDQVGAFYDFITPYFAAVSWGDSIHMGCWQSPDDTNEQAHQRLSNHVIDRVRLQSGERLLDVGCGIGGPAIECAKKSAGSVVGITMSASQVLKAKETARKAGLQDRMQFQRVNALQMPFEDSSFDAAMAIESFLYMPREQVLEEVGRVLRPGARLVFTDIIEAGPVTEVEQNTFMAAFALHSMVTLDHYRKAVPAAGLEIEDIFDVSHEVAPFFRKLYEATVANAAAVRDLYGPEFFGQLEGALQTLIGAYEGKEQKFGYVVMTVRKPA